MGSRLRGFSRKMRFSLRYRLMTAVLVCLVPICLVSCILFNMLFRRSEGEIHASNQARLDAAMAYWEEDTDLIDWAMENFLSRYLAELRYENLSWNDVSRYNMFFELEQILPRTEHPGLVALQDHTTGVVLAQMRDDQADDGQKDRLVQAFTNQLSAETDVADLTWLELEGQYYLIKRYDYRNGSILFALDLVQSIRSRVEPLCSEKSAVYLSDSDAVWELTGDGIRKIEPDWSQWLEQASEKTTLYWESEELPLALGVTEQAGIFVRLPWEIWVLLLVVVICLGNAFHLPRLIRLEVLEPADKLREAMRQIQCDRLEFRLRDTNHRNSEDMQYLFDTFDRMADEVQASREKDKKMYQAEMENLRLQVNPHMLLNSLNTIYSLAQMKKYEAIQEYALHLVDYFRYALRRNDNLVPVEQELAFVQTYIEIQKIRYPHALLFVYTLGKDCAGALVPPLLIQNFVENAVKYAVKPGKVTEILVNISRVADRLHISVADTGAGIKPEILERLISGQPYVDALGQQHIGVWNCRRRMEVFYREEPQIGILSGTGGTQVYLDVPYWTEVQA